MTVLLLAAWLTPDEALCYEKDPYQRKSIVGRVYLVYETLDATYHNQQVTSNRFQQTYSLDTKGNLLSRNLIVYDAGATWSLNDYNTNTSTTNSKTTRYYARTTILPRSTIPLTLHWSTDTNFTDTTFSSTSTTQSVNKDYGLDWSGRFRTLPTTRISADTTENDSSNSHTRSNIYFLDMEKELGPTKNHLNFNEQNQNTRSATSVESTDRYSLNIDNKTKIGRSTDLTAGFTKGETGSSTSGTGSTVQGISLMLNSKPSDEFIQTHNYSFFSNKSIDSTQEGTNYTGALSYSTGKTFNSILNLNINNLKSDSSTSKTRNDNLVSNAYARYSLSTHWFVSQQIKIDNNKTNYNVSTINTNNHSIFKSLTALNYNRAFKWTGLLAYYGAGYTKETYAQLPSGRGLAQEARIELNNINVIKYAGFNALAGLTHVENTAGQANSSSERYSLSGFNKTGRKYVGVSANFTRSFNHSWNSQYDTVYNSYMLAANSTYFRYTTLGYTHSNSSTFNSIDGMSKNSFNNFTLGHNRPLFSGRFTSMFNYGLSDTNTRNRVTATDAESAAVGYSRKVFNGTFSTALDYSSTHGVDKAVSADERDRAVSLNFSGNTNDINLKHAMISYKGTLFKGALSTSFDYFSKHEAYQLTFRNESKQKIGLTYRRSAFNGNLLLSYNTSTQNFVIPSIAYSTILTDYSAKYSTVLFRRVSWKAYYSVNKSKTNYDNTANYYNTYEYTTSYINVFAYQLRSWSFTAEQSYKVTQSQSGEDTTEAKMMFTAERTFFRVF